MIIASASFTLAAACPAHAAPCLERPDAEALMVFALPAMIEAAGKRCTPNLPATSALSQGGAFIAGKYRDASEAAWPLASGAVDRLAGFPLTRTLGQDAARKTVRDLVTRGVYQKLNRESCAKADRFVDILSPLPARNLARLAIALMETRPASSKDPISLCPVTMP